MYTISCILHFCYDLQIFVVYALFKEKFGEQTSASQIRGASGKKSPSMSPTLANLLLGQWLPGRKGRYRKASPGPSNVIPF